MTDYKSPVDDEIYIMLVEARDMLISNFEEVKRVYGDEAYAIAFKAVQAEHDFLLAEIDKRIHRRVATLALEQLSQ